MKKSPKEDHYGINALTEEIKYNFMHHETGIGRIEEVHREYSNMVDFDNNKVIPVPIESVITLTYLKKKFIITIKPY
jgi:hypothetical protein